MKTSKVTNFKKNSKVKVLSTKQTTSVKGGRSVGSPEEVAPKVKIEIEIVF